MPCDDGWSKGGEHRQSARTHEAGVMWQSKALDAIDCRDAETEQLELEVYSLRLKIKADFEMLTAIFSDIDGFAEDLKRRLALEKTND